MSTLGAIRTLVISVHYFGYWVSAWHTAVEAGDGGCRRGIQVHNYESTCRSFQWSWPGTEDTAKPLKLAAFSKLLCWLLISSESKVVGGYLQSTLGTLSLPLGG